MRGHDTGRACEAMRERKTCLHDAAETTDNEDRGQGDAARQGDNWLEVSLLLSRL